MITVIHKRNPQTGGQYRKTLQFGYDRQQGIDRWMGQRLNGLNPWKWTLESAQEIEADMYACGFLQPHYPVPALPLLAYIGTHGTLKQWKKRLLLYLDLQNNLAN